MAHDIKGILGVDIGGVIMESASGGPDTSFFGPNYLATPPIPGAIDALHRLAANGYTLWLVSKCGESVERKTRHWLDHHHIYQRTGLDRDRVRFCRTREAKAPICDEIGATHFIDDRLEVLSHMHNVASLLLFRGDAREVSRFPGALSRVSRVGSWSEVLACLLGQSARVT